MTGASAKDSGSGTRDFGFRRVAGDEHAGLVRGVFDSVAGRYDLMNDLMSAGLHRLWKRALIDWMSPRPAQLLVDVAGGTGDVALRFLARADEIAARKNGAPARAIVVDPTEAMVRVGRAKALDRGRVSGIDAAVAPAEALPLASSVADACTISFGLRNVTDRPAALVEMRRILKTGGHFLCLEFSPGVLPAFDAVYDAYSFRVLPWLGEIVVGDRDSYQYLVESIRRFPAPATLADEMRAAGFANVSWRVYSGGVVAIHSGWRV
jgi:demethylmenaquinone methyltransferase/2-methoxy-6-polyprenyl-1,4-benzoquinol methylase